MVERCNAQRVVCLLRPPASSQTLSVVITNLRERSHDVMSNHLEVLSLHCPRVTARP